MTDSQKLMLTVLVLVWGAVLVVEVSGWWSALALVGVLLTLGVLQVFDRVLLKKRIVSRLWPNHQYSVLFLAQELGASGARTERAVHWLVRKGFVRMHSTQSGVFYGISERYR